VIVFVSLPKMFLNVTLYSTMILKFKVFEYVFNYLNTPSIT
jgi:hypothetical protein